MRFVLNELVLENSIAQDQEGGTVVRPLSATNS